MEKEDVQDWPIGRRAAVVLLTCMGAEHSHSSQSLNAAALISSNEIARGTCKRTESQ